MVRETFTPNHEGAASQSHRIFAQPKRCCQITRVPKVIAFVFRSALMRHHGRQLSESSRLLESRPSLLGPKDSQSAFRRDSAAATRQRAALVVAARPSGATRARHCAGGGLIERHHPEVQILIAFAIRSVAGLNFDEALRASCRSRTVCNDLRLFDTGLAPIITGAGHGADGTQVRKCRVNGIVDVFSILFVYLSELAHKDSNRRRRPVITFLQGGIRRRVVA
jgi:hypothetical protein